MTIHQSLINTSEATSVELPEAQSQGELVEDVCSDFFAPAPTDVVDRLVARYRDEAANVRTVGSSSKLMPTAAHSTTSSLGILKEVSLYAVICSRLRAPWGT